MVEKELREHAVKVEEFMTVAEDDKPSKQESVSSESESEDEAEYHPNVSVSLSHTQIPEEEEEQVENDTADILPPVTAAAPAEEQQTQDGDQPKEVVEKESTEQEKESRETEESTDDPMLTPEETLNGLPLPEDGPITEDAPAEEQGEPKMNGEASVVDAEWRPQVICCSEVNSSPDRLRTVHWLRPSPVKHRHPRRSSFLLTTALGFPSRLREYLGHMPKLWTDHIYK